MLTPSPHIAIVLTMTHRTSTPREAKTRLDLVEVAHLPGTVAGILAGAHTLGVIDENEATRARGPLATALFVFTGIQARLVGLPAELRDEVDQLNGWIDTYGEKVRGYA